MTKKLFLTGILVLSAALHAAALDFGFDRRSSVRVSFRDAVADTTVPPASGPALGSAPADLSPLSGETVAPGVFTVPFRAPSRGTRLTAQDREAEARFILSKLESVYSHLENKQRIYGFSYEALRHNFLAQAMAASTDAEYHAAVGALVKAFHDPHLGAYFYDSLPPQGAQGQLPPMVTNTLTEDGILVTKITKLYGSEQELKDLEKGLEDSLELAKTAKALVVDVRGNPGGSDAYTRRYIARLIEKPIHSGVVTVKISSETLARYNGDIEEDAERPGWSVWYSGHVYPKGEEPFKGPVALLIDGGCVSSCEGTALMFKFSGIAKLYGETTMGSSGYPVTIQLPFSRGAVRIPTWIQMQPNGDPIEDHGITPHVKTDPRYALEAALADIRAALKEKL
jgi:hypothetical protein